MSPRGVCTPWQCLSVSCWAMCGSGCLSVSPCLPLGVCVCCANTAVAAWSQWLLKEWFFNWFSFPSPTPSIDPVSSPEQRVSPLVRSLCPCCPSMGWLLWGHLLPWPLVELQEHNPHSDLEKKQLHTDRWAGDKHRPRVTFTSFFMKLNVAPCLGGRYSARRTLYMLLNSDIPGWPDFGQLQHQQTLDFWALQTV